MNHCQPPSARRLVTLLCRSVIVGGIFWAASPVTATPVIARHPLAVAPSHHLAQQQNLPQDVARKLLQQVSRDTQIATEKLKIVAVKQANFDGCLGIYRPNQPCTRILISGWQAIISSPQRTFVYHLSRDARRIAQNDTASGAGKAINVSFELFGGNLPTVEPKVIFQSVSTGSLIGSTTTIALTEDGKVTEFTIGPNIRPRPVVRRTLTPKQVESFKKLLQTQRFLNLNRLSYLTSAAFADYPTTTYQTPQSGTQFIDLEKKSLPTSLQRIVEAWERLIRA
jgi:hypothetical protein